MNNLKQHLFYKVNNIFSHIILLVFIISFSHSQVFASEDKDNILAMSNWASINFPTLFNDDYAGSFNGFGYRYVCFSNNNCIGIKEDTVDILIDGEIVTVGSISDVLSILSGSNNGILNLSAISIDDKIIPAVYSPEYGQALEIQGQVISITWQIIVNEGTGQQEICDFSVIVNSADPTTVSNITFTRSLFSGADGHQWSLFASSNAGLGLPGIEVDNSSKTLKITENIELPKISGGSDILTILKEGTLLYKSL